MAKNLAIIVGIADYIKTEMQLPACENDVQIMQTVLRIGGRFEEIIVIPPADAQSLKVSIASTVERYKHDDIDDLLFYFTGHGEFFDDDFSYLLRDFDDTRRAQTSLTNSELDNILKSLEPGNIIKIVDACYSGVPYIKDGSDFSRYINNSSKELFRKCYFMFSSESDQKSYADGDGSIFTKAFAKAIIEIQSQSIRYKDIIDFLSDHFSGRPKQKPLFVVQASFIEIFGSYSSESKDQIRTIIENVETDTEVEEIQSQENSAELIIQNTPSLLSLVLLSAESYITHKEASDLLANFKSLIEALSPPSEINEIYEIKKEFLNNYSRLPNQKNLGEWISHNEAGEYFADPYYVDETYEVERPWGTYYPGMYGENKITRTRKVIAGIETELSDVPFITCLLTLIPKYPNLLQYAGWMTYIISKTKIQIFYCFTEYIESTWGKYEQSTNTKWIRIEFILATNISATSIIDEFYTKLSDWVVDRVTARIHRLSPTPMQKSSP